jgi:hypothetical protein
MTLLPRSPRPLNAILTPPWNLPDLAAFGFDDIKLATPPPAHELHGLQVMTNVSLTDRVQIRFGKSKRKRLRRKQARNPANWVRRPKSGVFILWGCTLIGHPDTLRELAEQCGAAIRRCPDGTERFLLNGIPAYLTEYKETLQEKFQRETMENFWDQMLQPLYEVFPSRPSFHIDGGPVLMDPRLLII